MPDDVDARMLDPDVRKELRSLTRESADLVARHLVMTGRLIDEEPERALAHARAARAMAGRVGVVREAAGLAAYSAGEWAEALSELRTARRITGRPEHLGVMADCERAQGRPERALAYADDPEVQGLPQDQRVELVIVLAGARRDLGQADAAVLTLQDPARRTTASRPWAARLWYAYADALLAAGRGSDARTWFERAAEVDAQGETDAGDRLLELDGVVLEDFDDESDGEHLPDDQELAAVVAAAFPRPAVDELDGTRTDGEPLLAPDPVDDEPTASDGAQQAAAGPTAPPDQVSPDQVSPDQVSPDQVSPDQVSPDQAAPGDQAPAGHDKAPARPDDPFASAQQSAAVDELLTRPAVPAGSLMPQFASPPAIEADPQDEGEDVRDDRP